MTENGNFRGITRLSEQVDNERYEQEERAEEKDASEGDFGQNVAQDSHDDASPEKIRSIDRNIYTRTTGREQRGTARLDYLDKPIPPYLAKRHFLSTQLKS